MAAPTNTEIMAALSEAISLLHGLDLRIAALEQIAKGAPTAIVVPEPTGGLYRFKRPAERKVSLWPKDRDMTSPDAEEAFQRSLHGVNWRGGALEERSYEEAWFEIGLLKQGEQKLIDQYRDLDPEFAGFALLTGLISPVSYDAMTFGVNASVRRSFAGKTIQSFLDDQFQVLAGGGGPGIGGE